jgi:hypothetical protein
MRLASLFRQKKHIQVTFCLKREHILTEMEEIKKVTNGVIPHHGPDSRPLLVFFWFRETRKVYPRGKGKKCSCAVVRMA